MPLTNERQFISDVERSSPRQFAATLRDAAGDTERVLRTHFGDTNFERMQALAQTVNPAPAHSVIMLPGILGSELHEGDETIWMDIWSLMKGDFDQLQVNMDGSSVKSIQAPAMLKKYYGAMQMALLQTWDVIPFPFDWRLDIAASARALKATIEASVPPGEPLRFAAHSMGGLVVRSFLQQFPDQWERVQLLIMMGTPNYGSFAIPVLYNGLNAVLKLVSLVDQTYDEDQLLQFAKLFVGTYEMLPFIGSSGDAERLFKPETYGDLNPPQQRFDYADQFQRAVAQTIRPEKMRYIAGFKQKTPDGIADWNRLHSWSGYHQTLAGDGTVPHSLGLIKNVTTYFVEAEHSSLPSDDRVISAVRDLLANGETNVLPTVMPSFPALVQMAAQTERLAEGALNDARGHLLAGIVRLEKHAHPDKISRSEAELRDLIFSGMSRASNS